MSEQNLGNDADATPEMVVVDLQVLDADGNPDPEALADLAEYLNANGFPVTSIPATDPSVSSTGEADDRGATGL